MVQARLTAKGQITIPKKLETIYICKLGSKVDFVIDENGDVKVVPLNVAAERLSGILHQKGMKTVSLEEMEQAIVEGINDWTRY